MLERCSQMTIAAMITQQIVLKRMVGRFAPRAIRLMRVPTGALNEMLARATAKVQPPSDKGKRLKVFYITQISTRPPTFVCFVNQKALFHFSYQRYLENQIRETFGLTGTPIKMITREHGDGAVKAGKV